MQKIHKIINSWNFYSNPCEASGAAVNIRGELVKRYTARPDFTASHQTIRNNKTKTNILLSGWECLSSGETLVIA